MYALITLAGMCFLTPAFYFWFSNLLLLQRWQYLGAELQRDVSFLQKEYQQKVNDALSRLDSMPERQRTPFVEAVKNYAEVCVHFAALDKQMIEVGSPLQLAAPMLFAMIAGLVACILTALPVAPLFIFAAAFAGVLGCLFSVLTSLSAHRKLTSEEIIISADLLPEGFERQQLGSFVEQRTQKADRLKGRKTTSSHVSQKLEAAFSFGD